MGVWKGWYEQNGQRHEMKIQSLKVKGCRIAGKGNDANGEFEIVGLYTQDNKVNFIK